MSTLTAPSGDDTSIRIVAHTDSVCAPCPHKRNLNCTSQEKITQLDHAHANALNFQPNQTITWGEAKAHLATHLTLEKFHTICATCEWKEYGICEGVIKTKILK